MLTKGDWLIHLFENFCNIKNVFTITNDQFNAYLLNTPIH